jgi:hypothetical protein
MRGLAALVALGLVLVSCNRQNPYRDKKSNPAGSPSDRTGGARSGPDKAGGGK